jgi:c-di-GMP-binding flagellar brake protein YcgR
VSKPSRAHRAAAVAAAADRRRYPRINRKIRLRYEVKGEGPLPIAGEGETVNLSRGGIGILLDEQVRPGTILDVELRFPFSPIPFAAKGQVVWVDESPEADGRYPAGLRFTEVTMDGGDLVARVFRNHLGL